MSRTASSLLLAISLALAACSKPVGGAADEQVEAAMAPASKPRETTAEASAARTAAASADATDKSGPIVTAPLLAYAHDYTLQAPAKAIRRLVSRHEAACAAAGPAVCQVTGATVQEMGEDRLRGTLSLRATPAWLKTFRDGLAADAQGAGGRVVRASTTSEDLSRQIVDTEAALRARTTLRTRLEALLATRPGKLADLLAVEQELARVQGEIDATQSELAMMRTRVATSKLDITYESEGVLAPQGVGGPLIEAVRDVVGIFVVTLAAMVRIIAWTAPWVLLIGGAYWLMRKRLPKRAPKAAEPPQP